jgi:hypothetical protein
VRDMPETSKMSASVRSPIATANIEIVPLALPAGKS